MKKFFAVLLILSLLAALPFVTLATSENAEEVLEPEMDTMLEGLVTEIVDGGFIMEDVEQGKVMVNTSDATVWDGLLAEEELAADQYVFVEHNGAMTRSLPPQVHADRVGLYMLNGIVTEVLEDGSILMNDWLNGEVIVHLPEGAEHVHAGSAIAVYHDGTMTLSLPAQVSASHIKLISATGVIAEVTENGFLMNTLDGQIFMVSLNGSTVFTEEALPEDADLAAFEAAQNAEIVIPQLYPGAAEDEEEMAASIEEEIAADVEGEQEIEAEIGSDGETETASGFLSMQPVAPAAPEGADEPAVITVDFAAGDKVTVYYNGVMTRSIPAQITALEVVVLR